MSTCTVIYCVEVGGGIMYEYHYNLSGNGG